MAAIVVASPEGNRVGDEDAEMQFKLQLVESGLLTQVRTPTSLPSDVDRTPIQVIGKPLSKVIIEERR